MCVCVCVCRSVLLSYGNFCIGLFGSRRYDVRPGRGIDVGTLPSHPLHYRSVASHGERAGRGSREEDGRLARGSTRGRRSASPVAEDPAADRRVLVALARSIRTRRGVSGRRIIFYTIPRSK